MPNLQSKDPNRTLRGEVVNSPDDAASSRRRFLKRSAFTLLGGVAGVSVMAPSCSSPKPARGNPGRKGPRSRPRPSESEDDQ
ncbi:twin-arginine translocation signal domain-containing protein [Actinomadura sp. CNU-125]|uniref:twin-arginine translocation signal domain-containing protein n=1 Tax=Actinomadura sp. CNU-125 TaxID=1904961 RepID=UPI0009FB53AC